MENKNGWHYQLFVIHKKFKTAAKESSRTFTLKLKTRDLFSALVVTSIQVKVHKSHYRIVTKEGKNYLQLTTWWYINNKLIFSHCLTFLDEIRYMQQENRSTLDDYLLVKHNINFREQPGREEK
nr:MAG: hypothetical protein [uncultured archaeon]